MRELFCLVPMSVKKNRPAKMSTHAGRPPHPITVLN